MDVLQNSKWLNRMILFFVFFLPLTNFAQNSNFDTATKFFLQKDYFNSSIYYSKAIIDEPNNSDAYFNRGLSFFHLEMKKEFCSDMFSAKSMEDFEAEELYSIFCINYDTVKSFPNRVLIYATDKFPQNPNDVKILSYDNSLHTIFAEGTIKKQDTIWQIHRTSAFFDFSFFPEGNDSLNTLIASIIIYPEIAIENEIEGRVLVYIIVSKDGDVIDAEIYNTHDTILNKEAIRVAKTLTGFAPGKIYNQPIISKQLIKINFRLD